MAAVKAKAAVVWGKVEGSAVEMMLDSGSTVSLVHQEVLSQVQGTTSLEAPRPLRLVTASGDQLPIKGHVRGTIQLGELEFTHTFVVVPKLVAPVILGVDFLHANGLVLDFTQTPVRVYHANACLVTPPGDSAVRDDTDTTAGWQKMAEDPEYSVPLFQRSTDVQPPECPKASFLAIVEEYQDLFWTNPGLTDQACHFIPTTRNPVRVPPRRIPAQYRKEVDKQLEEMLQLGIITESKSAHDFLRRKEKVTALPPINPVGGTVFFYYNPGKEGG